MRARRARAGRALSSPRPRVEKGRHPKALARRKERFIEELEKCASVTRACELSGFPRRSAYVEREADSDFALAWDQAMERGIDALEDEATRRAAEGYERPIFQGGKRVGTERVYSDKMMEIMLKARRPERFREGLSAGLGGGDLLAILVNLSKAERPALLTDERGQVIDARPDALPAPAIGQKP